MIRSPCAVLMLILLRMLTTRFAPCELRASIRQLELLQIASHRPPGPPRQDKWRVGNRQWDSVRSLIHSMTAGRATILADPPRSLAVAHALRLDDRQTRQGGGGEAAPTGETRQTRDTHTKIR